MLCNWVFCDKDGQARACAVLDEPTLPHTGDGKVYEKIGYTVKLIGQNMLISKNPLIVAIEH